MSALTLSSATRANLLTLQSTTNLIGRTQERLATGLKVNSAIDAKTVTRAGVALVEAAVGDFDRVLGIIALRRAEDAQPPVPVEEIERLIDERKAARARRDFAAADQIRVSLADRGILLEDNPSGTRWKRK